MIASRPPRPRVLGALVFVVGAGSLGTEIAAARLLAPYFGASTIVWANTIATVLASLSAGYWLGGRMADRWPELRGMCSLVLAAGVLLAVVPFVGRPFLGAAVGALQRISAGVAIGSLASVLVLVALPVLLLGAVSPYAVRLAVARVEESGRVTGRLYALSTAGSLLGTFLAALVLVPFAGTHRTFLTFALALTLAAAVGLPRLALAAPALIVVLLALPPPAIRTDATDGRVIFQTETPYQYARVLQDQQGTRRLELNEGLAIHSQYRSGAWLTGDYWDDFLVLPLAVLDRAPSRVAILGDAAGTTARAYGHYFPTTAVDGVEIDGRLTGIGQRFFALGGPRLRLVSADARPFLHASRGGYDAIFVDAYRQPYVPFYLTTREFFSLVRSRLAPGGVVIVNVGHPAGSSTLERALSATMRTELAHVGRDPVTPTNTLLIAYDAGVLPHDAAGHPAPTPAALDPLAQQVAGRLGPALHGGTVLTDDRAPVEWLIDSSILQYATRAR